MIHFEKSYKNNGRKIIATLFAIVLFGSILFLPSSPVKTTRADDITEPAATVETTIDPEAAADTNAGIYLQINGNVEPMHPFLLTISQNGGDARTSITFDPNMMFADTLPSNMTEVQYDNATHTLSFAWDTDLPATATVRLITAAAANQDITALSGKLSGTITVVPLQSDMSDSYVTSITTPDNTPSDVLPTGDTSTEASTDEVQPSSEPGTDAADNFSDEPTTTAPSNGDIQTSADEDNIPADSSSYNTSEPSDTQPITTASDTEPAETGIHENDVPMSDMVFHNSPAPVVELLVYTNTTNTNIQFLPTYVNTYNTGIQLLSAGGSNIVTTVFPLSASVKAGNELDFAANMIAAGINSDYTGATWTINLYYDPEYATLNEADVPTFEDLGAPEITGEPGSETITYTFPATLAPEAIYTYQAIIKLITQASAPVGAAFNITSSFNSNEDSFSNNASQTITAESGVAGSPNLSNFIDGSPVITDPNNLGQPITYVDGNTYDFTINFSEVANTSFQFAYDDGAAHDSRTDNTLYYWLPASLVVQSEVDDQPIFAIDPDTGLLTNVQIGTYCVYTDGLITAKFGISQNDGTATTPTGTNWTDFYSDAAFTLTVSAQLHATPGSISIDFGNDVTVDITVLNPNATTLKISKKLDSYDPATNKAKYIVTLTAMNGDVNNIVLTDFLQGGPNNAVLDPHGKISDVTVSPSSLNLTAAATPAYEIDNKHFDIALTGTGTNTAGALPKNQTVTVTYTVDLSSWISQTADKTNYSFPSANTVDANGADKDNNAISPAEATVTDTIAYKVSLTALKSLTNLDQTTNKATFQVTVTAPDNPVSSIVLTDNLTATVNGALVNFNPSTANITVVSVSSGSGISDSPLPTVSYNGSNFSIPLTGTLAKGESVTVTYTMDLSSIVSQTSDSANYNIPFTNYVNVTANDATVAANSLGPITSQVTGTLSKTTSPTTITATKTFQKYDAATGTASFYVGINAFTGGDVHDPVLTDTMTINSTAFDQTGKVTVTSTSPANAITYMQPVSYTSDGNAVFSFPSYTVTSNTSLTVYYSVDVSSWIGSPTGSGNDAYNYTYSYSNTINEIAYDSGGNQLTAHVSITGNIISAFTSKSGTVSDSNNGVITWSNWNVGNGAVPLNGATITDTLPDGLKFYDPTIQVIFYDKNGNSLPTSTQNITPNNTAVPPSFTINVPAGSDIYYAKIASYKTQIIDPTAWYSGKTYTNHIGVDFGDGTGTGKDFTVSPPQPNISGLNLTKTGVLMKVSDQDEAAAINATIFDPKLKVAVGDEYVQWTIYWQIPTSLYKKPTYLMDSISVNTDAVDGKTWAQYALQTGTSVYANTYSPTYLQIYKENSTGGYDLWDSGNYCYTPAYGTPGSVGLWGIAFAPADSIGIWGPANSVYKILSPDDPYSGTYYNADKISMSPFDSDTTLKITYITPLDSTYLSGGTPSASGLDVTLGDAIKSVSSDGSQVGYVSNTGSGYYSYDNNHWQSVSQNARVYYPIYKYVSGATGNIVHYNVRLFPDTQYGNTPNGELYAQSAENTTFYDTFDPQMTYVPFTWYVEGYNMGAFATVGGAIADQLNNYITGNTMAVPFDVLQSANFGDQPKKWVPGTVPDRIGGQSTWWGPGMTCYTIHYDMQLKDNLAPGTYDDIKNTATIYGWDSDATATVTQPVIKPTISKTDGGQILSDNVDGSDPYILFTIKYDIPGQLYGLSVSFEDHTNTFYYYDPTLGKYNYCLPSNPADIISVTAMDAATGVTTPFTDYKTVKNTNTQWQFLFTNTTNSNSVSPFRGNTTITVKYKIPLNGVVYSTGGAIIKNPDGSNMTIEQALTGTAPGLAPNGFMNDSGNFVNVVTGYYMDSTHYVISSDQIYSPIKKTAVVEADGVTVDYTITMNASQNVSTDSNGIITKQGYSFTSTKTAQIFTDTFDSGMTYVRNTFYVSPTNVGTSMAPYTEFGTDDWIEVLPSATPGKSTFSVDFSKLVFTSNYPGSTPGSDWPNDGSRPKYVSPGDTRIPENWYLNPDADAQFTIHYKMKYTGGSSDPVTVGNNANAYNMNANATATVTPPKEVSKTMDRNGTSGNSVTATIFINPDGKQFNGGKDEPMTATDTMSDILSAYLNTIKIYMETTPGSGEWVLQPANTMPDVMWSYTPMGSNQINFIIPDMESIKITYNCLVVGDPGSASINNRIDVVGYYSVASDNSFQVTDTNASGSGSRLALTVHKYDADSEDTSLAGAQFALYAAMMTGEPVAGQKGNGTVNPGWSIANTPPSGVASSVTLSDGTKFYYVGTGGYGTTDANGNYIFSNSWLTKSYDMTYLLVETQVPVGYAPLTAPSNYTLLSYYPQNPIDGIPVNQVGDNVSVANTKIENSSAVINGYKTVNGTNVANKVFNFKITALAGTDPDTIVNSAATTFGQGSFGFTLQQLSPNETYKYQITEVTDSDTAWTYDINNTSAQTVIVTTNGDNPPVSTVTYPAGFIYTDANNIQYENFTNTYMLADATIPVLKTISGTSSATVDMPAATFDLTQITGTDNPLAGPIAQTVIGTAPLDTQIVTGLTLPNNLSGSASFTINALNPGSVTYYIVTEENNSGSGYWTFDQSYAIVKVSVDNATPPTLTYDYQEYAPDGNGGYQTMTPPLNQQNGPVQFTNSYSMDLKAPLTINKTLTGADSTTDKFSFIVTEIDASGNAVIGGYTNTLYLNGILYGGKGSVSTTLPAAIGTKYYKIIEATGSDANMKYDSTVYLVQVTGISDGSEVTLNTSIYQAVIKNDNVDVASTLSTPIVSNVSFTNTFTGGPRLPDMGGNGIIPLTAAGAVMLFGAVGMIFYSKKKESVISAQKSQNHLDI